MEELKTLATKLNSIQCELQECKLKKSGRNKFSNFDYFELSDFLPSIVRLCKKYNVLTYISFNEDLGTLTAINGDKPEEQISITSPLIQITMKGANEIQALGAVETYTRRYLYLALFNITEPDTLDATSGKEETNTTPRRTTTATPKPRVEATPKPEAKPIITGGAEDYLNQAKALSSNAQRLLQQDEKWITYTLQKAGVKKVEDIPEEMVVAILDYLFKKGELK